MAINQYIEKDSSIRQDQWCCPPEGVHDCMTYNYGNPVTGFLAHEYFQTYMQIQSDWTPWPPYGGFFGSVTDAKFVEFGVDKPANYQAGYLQYQSDLSGWGDGWYGSLQNVVNGGIYKIAFDSQATDILTQSLYFIHPCIGRIEIPNNFNLTETNVVYFQLSNNPSFLPQTAPSDEFLPVNKPGGTTPPDAIGPGIGHMDIPLPDFGEMEVQPGGGGLGPPQPRPQKPPGLVDPISSGTSEIVPELEVKPSPGSIDHLGFTDEPLYPNQCNCGAPPGVFNCGEFAPPSMYNPTEHYGSLDPVNGIPASLNNQCAPGAQLPKWFTDCMMGSTVLLQPGNNDYYQDAGVCWLPTNSPSPNAGGGFECVELLWSDFTPQWPEQPLDWDSYQYEWIEMSGAPAIYAMNLGWRLCEWPDSCNCEHYENSYSYPGCMDGTSPNFNPLANYEDGTCYSYGEQVGPDGLGYIPGCIDEMFNSYNPFATIQSQPKYQSCNPPIANWYKWEALNPTGETFNWEPGDGNVYTYPVYGDIDPPSCDVLCSTGGSDSYGNSWEGKGLNCYGEYNSGHCPKLENEFSLDQTIQHANIRDNARGGMVYWEVIDILGDDPDGYGGNPYDDKYNNGTCSRNLPRRGGSNTTHMGYAEIYCCCG